MKRDLRQKNLERWIRSGAGLAFVADRDAEWSDVDWVALVEELKTGDYWPISVRGVGLYLEETRRRYLIDIDKLVNRKPLALPTSTLVSYAVGIGAIGLLMGMLAGASNTPIVATILPLLFAIIGGTGGIYVTSLDLSSVAAHQKLRVLGVVLATFSIVTLLGLAIGVSVRFLGQRKPSPDSTAVKQSTIRDDLELSLLQARLIALGTTPEGRDTILKRAAEESAGLRIVVDPQMVHEAFDNATRVADILRSSKDPTIRVASTLHELDVFCLELQPWISKAKDVPGIRFHRAIDSALSGVRSLMNDASSLQWLSSRQSTVLALQEFVDKMESQGLPEWMAKDWEFKVDEFLKVRGPLSNSPPSGGGVYEPKHEPHGFLLVPAPPSP